jgi:hypothetical protein|tara:strand:- start:8 stop:160 length:153 start_codon:yes stop_codon:yes gene_type:complete
MDIKISGVLVLVEPFSLGHAVKTRKKLIMDKTKHRFTGIGTLNSVFIGRS